jgi:hypothetical protein
VEGARRDLQGRENARQVAEEADGGLAEAPQPCRQVQEGVRLTPGAAAWAAAGRLGSREHGAAPASPLRRSGGRAPRRADELRRQQGNS